MYQYIIDIKSLYLQDKTRLFKTCGLLYDNESKSDTTYTALIIEVYTTILQIQNDSWDSSLAPITLSL